MLLFTAFGVERHQTNIHVRLYNPLYANVEITGDLLGRFHIAFDAHLSNGKFLPAQTTGGNIRQQLWCFNRTANFYQPFRRTAHPRQRVIQAWGINRRVEVEVFNPQFTFYVRTVASQFQMQARDRPLQVAVPLQRTVHIDLVLLHVAGQLQLGNLHLPASAVQTAASFHQAIQF